MHSTNELNDGYVGSGKRLKYSIRKYGIENFEFEILEFLPDRESLVNRERELINEETLKDSNCLNIKQGGSGGFSYEDSLRGSALGAAAIRNYWKDDDYRKKMLPVRKHHNNNPDRINKIKKALYHRYKECKIPGPFTGKRHSNETKKKMSESAKGRNTGQQNSQFGTCWIMNDIENKKIKKSELINFLNNGWKLGRKIKKV
jgi:group I intron endonuclease